MCTSLKSVRKELSYSPLQRCSILCSISWCRMLVTASELTRSNSCSLELKSPNTFIKALYIPVLYFCNKRHIGIFGIEDNHPTFEVHITEYAYFMYVWNNVTMQWDQQTWPSMTRVMNKPEVISPMTFNISTSAISYCHKLACYLKKKR